MEYNSQREDLIIPEYGRNVQKMVEFATTIDDAEQRQLFTEMIVNLMMQMQPQGKNVNREYKEKLWNHVLMISKYKLEVDVPDGIEIVRSEEKKKPPRLEYPAEEMKYRHYGHNIKVLLEKAHTVEDPDKQAALLSVVGSYMKLAYKTWNKEHYVNDEMIKNDLMSMTSGSVKIPEDISLDFLNSSSSSNSSSKRTKRQPTQNQNNKRGKRRRK